MAERFSLSREALFKGEIRSRLRDRDAGTQHVFGSPAYRRRSNVTESDSEIGCDDGISTFYVFKSAKPISRGGEERNAFTSVALVSRNNNRRPPMRLSVSIAF